MSELGLFDFQKQKRLADDSKPCKIILNHSFYQTEFRKRKYIMHYIRILILSLVFLGFSCSGLKPPFYRSVHQEFLSTEWKLNVFRISYLGPVQGLWWGEEFYQLDIGLENQTDQFRFFKFFDQKMDKHNLLASLKSDEYTEKVFLENKNLFAAEDFFRQYPGIKLYFSLKEGHNKPTTTYNGELVFPEIRLNKDDYYSAAFVASDLGVPLKGGVVETSVASSGWLAPREFRKYSLYFSVPTGAVLRKVDYPGVLKAELVKE
ncbi:hypothetical protein [Leptospira kobayashii]|nr:hypothetical protein [Leptospira kobayashii]